MKKQVKSVVNDFEAAIAAAEEVKTPFTLATCGWVLGPQNDRALFDNTLPKNMPISCISKDVGFAFVEPGFAKVQGRPKWSIPWLEDDPALTVPQLWAGRMRRDAFDSLSYGCSGLMGIHWRTRITSPNIAALARAGWNQDFAKGMTSDPNRIERDPNNVPRDLPVVDFYTDLALAEFGPAAAEPMGKLFAKLDGGPFSNVIHQRKTNLPRPATWVDGPGGIKPDERDWREVQKSYAFVGEVERLRSKAKGKGYLERFDYWLDNFRYLREVGKLRCIYGRYNKEAAKLTSMKDAKNRKQFASATLLPIRKEMIEQLAKVHRYLLQTVSTKGEMGNVANWQQHIMPKLLAEPGKQLSEILGEEMLANKWPTKEYEGKARIFVPTVRGQLASSEDLRIKAVILDRQQPEEVSLYCGSMGTNKFKRVKLENIGRGVYAITVPAREIGEDIEYYIRATTGQGPKLYWPATAPKINQTVIVVEEGK